MYFGRNSYDPQAIAEAQTRLQSFQGAQSISSNQYFGREEEEDMGVGHPTDGGLLGDGTLAGLELAARDAVSKVLANPDVQNAAESIRQGALKVRLYRIHSAPSLALTPSSREALGLPCTDVRAVVCCWECIDDAGVPVDDPHRVTRGVKGSLLYMHRLGGSFGSTLRL